MERRGAEVEGVEFFGRLALERGGESVVGIE